MIAAAILIVYGVGWMLAARVIIGRMAYSNGQPDGEDFTVAIVCGGVTSLAWPVIVPVYTVWRFAPGVLIAKPRDVRLREREVAVRKRERDIARLEREALR